MSAPAVVLQEVFCLHRTADGDVAALQGATLTVPTGEQLGVLGPSGAGKSTLLRVVAGLELPAAGRACLGGHDIGRLPARRRAQLRHETVGFVAQDAAAVLAPELRAGRAIELPLALRGKSPRERRGRAAELLEAVGLADLAAARPVDLSGGERQRLALCVAIAHRPALLLADEPTASLDAEAAQGVRAAIARLASTYRLTAIVVTHDPATAAALDRTVQISDGRIAEESAGGSTALVVARGGWIQLSEAVLSRAGIGTRVRVAAGDGQVMLTPASGREGSEAEPDTARSQLRARGANPVTVELRQITRTLQRGGRRQVALRELTATFAPSRLTVIEGPSGSGKTTLLRLLCGLDRPDSGSVRVGALALEDLDAEARADLRLRLIGYVPQDPVPVGFLSATENIALALSVRGWAPGAAAERAVRALRAVGLGDRARQRTARVSAGEAQRLALARGLASARGLLIVDEPTSRLDRANARLVSALLVDAAHQDGQTVVCASHDEDLVARADAVVAL